MAGKEEAARLKAEGNELFRADKFAEAADKYSKAIEADSTEAALFSNRAACYASLDMWPESLQDATTCIRLRPDWAKGYFRRALAVARDWRSTEARSMCNRGLVLDKDSKELKDLRMQCQATVSRFFSNACDVDFRMDTPPNEDFKTVFKGKGPSKGAQINGPAFPQSQRTMLHVAVLMQHVKVVKELVERGADATVEDRMGLTPLHFAYLIQHEPILQALGDAAKLAPISSTHNATPQELAEGLSFAIQAPPVLVRVMDREGVAQKLDGDAFLVKTGVRYTRTCLFTDEYLQTFYSSILDDEGMALLADPRKRELSAQYRASQEEDRLALAYISEEVGYGVFSLGEVEEGAYVCCYAGLVQDLQRIREQAKNSYVMTVMPVERFPFKTDATLYRSFGAYINHSDTPNLTCEHIVAKGAALIVFVANKRIGAGEQLGFDYRGRLHTTYCEKSIPTFGPLSPLPAPHLAALQKL